MIEAVLLDEGVSLLSDRHLSLDEALDRMMSIRCTIGARMAFVALSDDSRLITLVADYMGSHRLAVLAYDRQYEHDATKPVYRETDIRWFDGEDLDSCRWSVVQFDGHLRDLWRQDR